MTPEQRDAIAQQLGEAPAATDGLIDALAKTVADRREHEHPKWEDLYCLNLTSYAGERTAPLLRRLLDAEARVAELEATQGTVYRAEHDSITVGLYITEALARKHCEQLLSDEHPADVTVVFDWIGDDEDEGAIWELTVEIDGGDEEPTGYTVTPLFVAAEVPADGEDW